MGNLFFGFVQFGRHLIQKPPHSFLPVQQWPGFLITGDVVLDLLLQILIDSFVFQNTEKALVNFIVEVFVLGG